METHQMLVNGMSIDDYHSEKLHVSASQLKLLKKSPKHFKNPPEQKQAKYFDIGNAFEAKLLEPDSFIESFAVFNKENLPFPESTMGKKENKEYVANFSVENEGKTILSTEDMTDINKMVKSCLNNDTVQTILSSGEVQQSIFYEHEGVKLKSRPDFISMNRGFIVDLKTIDDASPNSVSRAIANFNYHIQAITQVLACESLGMDFKHYFYLFQEKTEPFDTVVYRLTDETLNYSKAELSELLTLLKSCRENDTWGGYSRKANNSQGILNISLPAWAMM